VASRYRSELGWLMGQEDNMKLRDLLAILTVTVIISGNGSAFADGGDATLIHACVAKNGTMRLVSPTTACKNNETASHWPSAARAVTDEGRITNTETKNTSQDSSISAIQTKNTQQDAAIAALQGQVGGGSPVLVDRNAKVVGTYSYDSIYGNQVSIPVNGFVVTFIGVNISGFAGGTIYFTTPDCSGQPLVPPITPFGPATDLSRTGQWIDGVGYFPADPFVISFNTYNSLRSGGGTCSRISGQFSLTLASTIDLSGFTPPFHVE